MEQEARGAMSDLRTNDCQHYNTLMSGRGKLSLDVAKAKVGVALKLKVCGNKDAKKRWQTWVLFKRFKAFLVHTLGEKPSDVPDIRNMLQHKQAVQDPLPPKKENVPGAHP